MPKVDFFGGASRPWRRKLRRFPVAPFSTTAARSEVLHVAALPDRNLPKYFGSPSSSLLSLHWPEPPRNILLIPKLHAPTVVQDTVHFAKYLKTEYNKETNVNLIFESRIAQAIHNGLPFPIYTADPSSFPSKVDLVVTLGGDGTILRAASLFSMHASVPPILSFSMGSLGFLGEWKFDEYKRAFREVYMSGRPVPAEDLVAPHTRHSSAGLTDGDSTAAETGEAWDHVNGKSMGSLRASRILLRHRLKVGVYDASGENINSQLMPTATAEPHQRVPPSPPFGKGTASPLSFHAINELLIHRGEHPHLAIIDIYINNHFLTEAIADGILVSTPTGSTAYSLSAGGSIIHPLVKSLLITPICPRSLSFRPLVLPLNTNVVLRLSEKNRGRELEVSVDGKRRVGATIGMEVRLKGETLSRTADGSWTGGVPCLIRVPGKGTEAAEDDEGWVGGLNELLKFNYQFGETSTHGDSHK
jgi:NADH kinase